MEVYDVKTDSWDSSKEPMPTERIGLMVAAVDGILYAIGGRKIWVNADIAVVEAYDTRTNTWTMKSSMPQARSVAGCCVYNGKIYIMGGQKNYTTWMTSNDLQIYDPATDRWDDTKAKMNKSRGGLRACMSNDEIYAIGGYDHFPWNGLETIEAYDKVTDSWTIKTKLNEGRYQLSMNTVNGLIYIIGGESGTEPVNSVEVFDPVQNNCEVIDNTPILFALNSSNVYNSEIYLFGGSTSGGATEIFDPSNKVYLYKLDPAVSVESYNDEITHNFRLNQNYPNPFNPSTIISYKIPIIVNSERPAPTLAGAIVNLVVYDAIGREVTTLVNEEQKPGNYEVEFNGSDLTSGIYFYRLHAGNFIETRKMLLLR